MVWDGESEPPVVLTRWDLLRVFLGGAPVWPCGGGGRLHGGERQKASSVLPPTRAVDLLYINENYINSYHLPFAPLRR